MKLKMQFSVWCLLLATAIGCLAATPSSTDTKAKERKLIALLQSDAPPQEKALACKQLAIYGSKDAVKPLAALLADEKLASWARIPLEVIPGSDADKALRNAIDNLQGNLLIGTINSIAIRRDAKAISGLTKKLKHTDPQVASAAAMALARIGGTKAGKALEKALVAAPAPVRPEFAEACIVCAQGFLDDKDYSRAVKLYDAVRAADVPGQRVLEATRGAILARQSSGLPLLLEQLRSSDNARFGVGLRTARELPGRDVTSALAAELDRCNPERQAFLLMAVGDRTDDSVLPAVVKVAQNAPSSLRIVAIEILERIGNISTLPVLLDAAISSDPQLASAALGILTRWPGDNVDADLLARLPQSSGQTLLVLIKLAEKRRLEGSISFLLAFAAGPDSKVRSAAVQALGTLGSEKQTFDLVQILQKSKSADEQADIEMALINISERARTASVAPLLPLMQSRDSALQLIGLHALASAGGPGALDAVKSALSAQEETVRNEAVRTLSTWPNNWPEDTAVAEPLLQLVRSEKETAHVLGVRGYLQYLQGDKALKPSEKVAKIQDLWSLLQRPEEKRLAIAALTPFPTTAALELLTSIIADPTLSADASSALITLAANQEAPKELRKKALQAIIENTKDAATRKTAQDKLKTIN